MKGIQRFGHHWEMVKFFLNVSSWANDFWRSTPSLNEMIADLILPPQKAILIFVHLLSSSPWLFLHISESIDKSSLDRAESDSWKNGLNFLVLSPSVSDCTMKLTADRTGYSEHFRSSFGLEDLANLWWLFCTSKHGDWDGTLPNLIPEEILMGKENSSSQMTCMTEIKTTWNVCNQYDSVR